MSEVRLPAEVRSEFGKGGARRTRRAGKIPAVIYGHGADPRHVSLPAHEFAAAIRNGGANVLLTIEIEGKDELAIPKAIQRHAIKGTFDHVDLLAVRRGEKVTVEVPLSVVGEVVAGGLLAQEHLSIHLAAEATNLPTGIEVSIADLQIGGHITAGDLVLPEGAALIGDPEQVLLIMQEAPTAADMEAGEGAGIEAVAPAESPDAEAVPAAGEGSSTE